MTQARHLIIVNPQARHGEAERLAPVIEALLASVPHDTVETTGPGHATEIAAAAPSTTWSWPRAVTARCMRCSTA